MNYRYKVKLIFKRTPGMFSKQTEPIELEFKTKKELIPSVMDLYDETVDVIELTNRASNATYDFTIDNIEKFMRGIF